MDYRSYARAVTEDTCWEIDVALEAHRSGPGYNPSQGVEELPTVCVDHFVKDACAVEGEALDPEILRTHLLMHGLNDFYTGQVPAVLDASLRWNEQFDPSASESVRARNAEVREAILKHIRS